MIGRRPLLGLAACALLASTEAFVISKSRLQQCTNNAAGVHNCDYKLVVEYGVPTGENSTEALVLQLDAHDENDNSFLDEDTGKQYQLARQHVSLMFVKSAIYYMYPTTYHASYNYDPWEVIYHKDSSGHDFNNNPLAGGFNSCLDADGDVSPSCGWAVPDSVAAQTPPCSSSDGLHDVDGKCVETSSQGKCCSCKFSESVQNVFRDVADQTETHRGGLDCRLNGVTSLQSAHCLRWDPLRMHAFEISNPQYTYTIQVGVERCDKNDDGSTDQSTCATEWLTLSPQSSMATDTEGLVFARLIGDYDTAFTPPSFESKYLFVPQGQALDSPCRASVLSDPRRPDLDLSSRCLTMIAGGVDTWMFLDKHLVDDSGSSCNKVGVGYEGFRFESGFCERDPGSCLANQLDDYYNEDMAKLASDRTPTYLAKYAFASTMLGASNMQLATSSGECMPEASGTAGANCLDPWQVTTQGGRLKYATNLYQLTSVLIELSVDKDVDIMELINVGNATIVRSETAIPTFEENSRDGELTVTVQCNDPPADNFRSMYYISVLCTEYITVTGVEQSVSLGGGAKETRSWAVKADYDVDQRGGHSNQCVVTLKDAMGNKLDQMDLVFSTTETVEKVVQQGSAVQTTNGDIARVASSCPCSQYQIHCLLTNWSDCYVDCVYMVVIIGFFLICCCSGCCGMHFMGPRNFLKCLCFPFRCVWWSTRHMCLSMESMYDCFEYCCADFEDEETCQRKYEHKCKRRKVRKHLKLQQQKGAGDVEMQTLKGGIVDQMSLFEEEVEDILYADDDSVEDEDDYFFEDEDEQVSASAKPLQPAPMCEDLLAAEVVFFNIPKFDDKCTCKSHSLRHVKGASCCKHMGRLAPKGFALAGLLSKSDCGKKYVFQIAKNEHKFQRRQFMEGKWKCTPPIPIRKPEFFTGTMEVRHAVADDSMLRRFCVLRWPQTLQRSPCHLF